MRKSCRQDLDLAVFFIVVTEIIEELVSHPKGRISFITKICYYQKQFQGKLLFSRLLGGVCVLAYYLLDSFWPFKESNMSKTCDHTSVGVEIYRGDQLLMLERNNYPKAYALPAGHCDGDEFKEAAEREVAEEVGLTIVESNLVFDDNIQNPCKRLDGDHHHWKDFRALKWSGEVKAGSDAKKFFWASPKKLRQLAKRTEYFMRKYRVPYREVGELTLAIFGNPQSAEQNRTDEEWYWEIGLEPVWYYILKNTGTI